MGEGMNILLGTVGQGVMRSADGGETWRRVGVDKGLHSDSLIRSLAVHPQQSHIIYAGSDKGLYCSDDCGESWQHMDSALDNYHVWSLAIDPVEPEVMFAGTGTPTPATVFRSTDAGKTWEQRPMEVARECPAVGVPRVTGVAIDPLNRQNLWAGIEVDGLRRSTDRGDTWVTVNGGINNPDIHNVMVSAGPPKTVFTVVNNDLHMSTDDGGSWQPVGAKEAFPWTYCRGIAAQPGNPQVIFLSIGDTTPGSTGAVLRSRDTGKTWENLPLPVQPNSAVWALGMHRANPNLVFAASRYGYLYRSEDGGDSWTKLWREFSEVSSVTWVPN